MRKVIIACFLAILMLMLPVTSVSQTVNTSNITNTSNLNDGIPQIFINDTNFKKINAFIETNFEGDDKVEAYGIRDDIIGDDLKVDIVNLAVAFLEYNFQPIPENKLDAVTNMEELNDLLEIYWNVINGEFFRNFFGKLIDEILETIKNRLGWCYKFFSDSVNLFINGTELVIDYIQPAVVAISVLIVKVINDIISAPRDFADALKELFQDGDGTVFVNSIISVIDGFSEDFIALIEYIKNFIQNQKLISYLNEIEAFAIWLADEPWKYPVEVTGFVKVLSLTPINEVTITCRGQSITAKNNEWFSFFVDVSPSADSFPSNEWYGMHNCNITVLKEDKVLKQTPDIFSYVFSGGKIEWPFVIVKSRAKYTSFRELMLERFSNMLSIIQALFPNIFRNMNRLNIFST